MNLLESFLPEKLIYNYNFYSIDAVAEYFNVSKAALWIRLNNLKRLNLLSSRKIKTYPCCGNTNFSIFSEYCGICGTPLSNGLKGELRIKHPEEIPTDKHKRVLICPMCKQKITTRDKCSTCGTYIFNFCFDYITKGDSGCNAVHPWNFRYCEYCGKPIYFYAKGFISDWNKNDSTVYNYEFRDECYEDSL